MIQSQFPSQGGARGVPQDARMDTTRPAAGGRVNPGAVQCGFDSVTQQSLVIVYGHTVTLSYLHQGPAHTHDGYVVISFMP